MIVSRINDPFTIAHPSLVCLWEKYLIGIDFKLHYWFEMPSFYKYIALNFLEYWLKVQIIDDWKSEINQVGVLKLNLFWPVLTVCCSKGEFVRGTITKNNKVGTIIKDENGQRAWQLTFCSIYTCDQND